MVWMNRGSLASSPNTRRNSEIERVSTSSLTKVSAHTERISRSLVTTWPAFSPRQRSTCMIFGSTRADTSALVTVLSRGSTDQSPTRKAPCIGLLLDRAGCKNTRMVTSRVPRDNSQQANRFNRDGLVSQYGLHVWC